MSFETKFQILRPNCFLKYRIGNVFLKYVFIKNICYVTKIYKNNATLLLMLFLSLLMLWFVGSTHKYIDSRTTKPSRSYFYCFFLLLLFFYAFLSSSSSDQWPINKTFINNFTNASMTERSRRRSLECVLTTSWNFNDHVVLIVCDCVERYQLILNFPPGFPVNL